MWKIIWLDSAVNDVARLRQFLDVKNTTAAKNAAQIIKNAVKRLEQFPNCGRPVEDLIDYRDLFIQFGVAGYILRYRIHQDNVYIVHIRHYREKNFKRFSVQ